MWRRWQRILSSSLCSAAAAAALRGGALREIIRSGPVFEQAKLADLDDFDRWERLGSQLAASLKLSSPEEEKVRVYWLYLPVYEWIRRAAAGRSRPLFVGLQCPQGGGKTTMCDAIGQLFEAEGASCAVVSIDDFYKTHADLEALAARHPDNPLLHGRGLPGTHDPELARSTLDALFAANSAVRVPRYDKSARAGRGDRRPRTDWPEVKPNVDVVLLEGWCLGFQPRPPNAVDDPRMRVVNEYLRTDLAPIYERFDAFITIQVPDLRVVYAWREQAERPLRDRGEGAMTPDQVRTFVDRYMPCYHQYIDALYATDLVPGATLRIAIDAHRRPIRWTDPRT
ncbi:hypothetical protein CTAYLR_007351 [Chrysophaeum taylorii]|uniref:Glycerate kinase n=1 Tax=Chrysophaeum taylorii TaxID=2483200 RepID=A0AAD7UHU5_9STRA|nr:hypothetical protein CTAYLR_007351 [Chrysophaeum taylorii]